MLLNGRNGRTTICTEHGRWVLSLDIVKPDGHTDELIVLSNGVQKDIQIKDLKEAKACRHLISASYV